MLDLENHITRYSLLSKRVLVAISGGLDSVVLTHCLYRLGVDIILAHCNFQLRGAESDADQQFVVDFGDKLNIETLVKRFDTKKYISENQTNTQLAARKLRYEWFETVATEKQCDYIAVAHHADDNLETFIIHLSRGTGLDGLLGIPPKNGKIIRPLLAFSRDELYQYAVENQLSWREDSSNASDVYLRNNIRHHISPKLKELHPTFIQNFQQTLFHLQQTADFVDFHISELKKNIFTEENNRIFVDSEALKQLQNIDFVLHKLFYPYGFSNLQDLKQLLESESGKQLFSSSHRLLKNRNQWILESKTEISEEIYQIKEFSESIDFPIRLHFDFVEEVGEFSDNQIFVDADLINYPLVIRHKKDGDYFYPFGMVGKKKLSKFFKDEKYSLIEKEQQWLLCSGADIVWVVGRRLDNRFKVTKNTRQILKIQFFEKKIQFYLEE
ncbi:tRNA lysidine(34) synthetase TilS [Capnocytophaga canis]|uniref:tRNA lysidine(34) synthetase TilS n=1 Tax=Capnocytophaga canis TaxID=1848903 RepID=UPI0015622814|nr:tRNA lysidine(34) synthetase TilS [Capnocytophaga canis]